MEALWSSILRFKDQVFRFEAQDSYVVDKEEEKIMC